MLSSSSTIRIRADDTASVPCARASYHSIDRPTQPRPTCASRSCAVTVRPTRHACPFAPPSSAIGLTMCCQKTIRLGLYYDLGRDLDGSCHRMFGLWIGVVEYDFDCSGNRYRQDHAQYTRNLLASQH